MRNLGSTFLLVAIPFLLAAQNGKLEDAEQLFNAARYGQALEKYKEVRSNGSSSLSVTNRIADCYRRLRYYEMAEEEYQKLYEQDSLTGQDLLFYGHILRNNEKYDKATEVYQFFAENNADDPRGYYYKEASTWASETNKRDPDYKIQETGLETGGISLGAFPYKEGVIFSKPDIEEVKEGERTFYDLVYSKNDNGAFSKPRDISENINSKAHEGTPCVSKEGDLLFFTSNSSDEVEEYKEKKVEKYDISKKGENLLEIRVAEKNDQDKWELSDMELPFNSLDHNCAQPFLSPSGDSLFFVSDMKGGKGGYDIYLSVKTDTGWGEAQNLGDPINSLEDEMYPVMRGNTLYFSSYGHFNFGGCDIFKCEYNKDKGEWGTIKNMGKPLNSSKDDFGYIMKWDNTEEGYFSSNRNTSPGHDKIYTWKDMNYPDTIHGIARNKVTTKPIDGVKVSLFQGEEQESEQVTNETGKCKLILEQNTSYSIKFTKEGYEEKIHEVPKKDREDVIALLNSIELEPSPEKDNVINFDNIYFDYGKAALRDSAKDLLDNLADYMERHPKIKVELSAHTDSRSSKEFNMELSKDRAQSCFDYLKQKGIDSDRINPKGYGETRLVNECSDGVKCTEEQHQMNRRVEVKIL